MGHVRDLPKSQMGVDIEQNFEPKYITIRGKGPVLKELKRPPKGKKFISQPTPTGKGKRLRGIWRTALIWT